MRPNTIHALYYINTQIQEYKYTRMCITAALVKWDHKLFISCNNFHKLNTGWWKWKYMGVGVTRSTPFLSKKWGKLNWLENPLVSILLCKGLKEKFKLFEILHIFVWVLSDEIVFRDFTTFWCFSYLLEQIRPDVPGNEKKIRQKIIGHNFKSVSRLRWGEPHQDKTICFHKRRNIKSYSNATLFAE